MPETRSDDSSAEVVVQTSELTRVFGMLVAVDHGSLGVRRSLIVMSEFTEICRRRNEASCRCAGGRHERSKAYLGHRNIQHTVRYTELSPARFKNFWRE